MKRALRHLGLLKRACTSFNVEDRTPYGGLQVTATDSTGQLWILHQAAHGPRFVSSPLNCALAVRAGQCHLPVRVWSSEDNLMGMQTHPIAAVVLAMLCGSEALAQSDAELRKLAATFPPMPREVADLVPFVGGIPTFASGTPYGDAAYTVFETDYIDGENGGHDLFIPANPGDAFPGANKVRLVRCALNTDLDNAYGVTQGDRIVLGTVEAPQPFFLRGLDGIDNDYAVILHFDYEFGHIQLRGTPGEYRLIRVTLLEGAQTDGWYLFHVAGDAPDLVAFIYPCTVVVPAVSGNPPSNPNPYCFADGSLSLDDPRHFRYAQPVDATPSIPAALAQFGGAGTEVVGGLTVDASGNTYIVGCSSSDLDASGGGGNAIFVTRVGGNGAVNWTTELALSEGSLLFDAAADDEFLYVCGRTLGAIPGFSNAGRWDGVLLKLRLIDGAIVAQNQWGNPGIDGYGNILLDGRGGLYLSGQGSPPGPATNDNAYLVAKHSTATLDNIWRAIDPVPVGGFTASAEAWGGLSLVEGSTPAADRLVVAGWYFTANGADGFVATYGNLQGSTPTRSNFVTVKSAGIRAEWVFDSAVGPQGEIYVSGYTSGAMQGTPLGKGDAFLMRFDSNLANPIVRQFGTTEMDLARDIMVDAAGRVWVFGYTHGPLAGANGSVVGPSSDLFVRRFDAKLQPLDTVQFGSPWEDQARAVLGDNRLFVAGMTEGSRAAANLGSFDAFVAVLDDDLGFACRPDLDGSGTVDGGDIGVLLLDWGQTGPADLDRSGAVDGGDIGVLLLEWGDCGP